MLRINNFLLQNNTILNFYRQKANLISQKYTWDIREKVENSLGSDLLESTDPAVYINRGFSLLSVGNDFNLEAIRAFEKAKFFDDSEEYIEEINCGLSWCGKDIKISEDQLKKCPQYGYLFDV